MNHMSFNAQLSHVLILQMRKTSRSQRQLRRKGVGAKVRYLSSFKILARQTNILLRAGTAAAAGGCIPVELVTSFQDGYIKAFNAGVAACEPLIRKLEADLVEAKNKNMELEKRNKELELQQNGVIINDADLKGLFGDVMA